jgi:DNA-damage-inducible protein J
VSTTMLHIRVDDQTKERANDALDAMGMSMSEAVRLFLHRVAADQAIPFALKVPNAVTRAAMREAQTMRGGRFANAAEMFDALDTKAE